MRFVSRESVCRVVMCVVLSLGAGCTAEGSAHGDLGIALCSDDACSGHGTCVVGDAGVSCACEDGYRASGHQCLATTGACAGVSCSGHGICEEVDGGAECKCDPGYEASGLTCNVTLPDSCEQITCSGRGSCEVIDGFAKCVCEDGYAALGVQCVATSGPCAGIHCSGHGACNPVGGEAQCVCEGGYEASGTACVAVSVEPCADVDCSGHGVCHVIDDDAECMCEQGYAASGTQCLATSGPCAGIDCSGHGSCANIDDAAQCECDDGYEASGTSCIATTEDVCDGVTCSGHGVCAAVDAVAECNCDEGYQPSNADCIALPADPCQGITCSGHGSCTVVDDVAECDCNDGYEAAGTRCIAASGPCAGVTCSDHGTCDATSGTAECRCDVGYQASGTTCIETDPCEGVTCSGRGVCSVSEGQAVCDCPSGFRAVGQSCVPEGNACSYLDCPSAKTCGTSEQELFVRASSAESEQGTQTQPFRTLQAAIDAAADGAVINVAEGTYIESVQVTNKELHLCGGWNAEFSERDTSLRRPVLESASTSEPVVTLVDAHRSSVVGFEIRGGRAGVWVETLAWPEEREISDPRVSDNVIRNNGALTLEEQTHGGVIMINGYLSVTANVIQSNQGSKGSALMLAGVEALVRANTIVDNVGGSDHGGAIYDATDNSIVSDNLVQGNEVGALVGWGWGGGMIVLGHATLSGNVWTDNYAPSHGGALFVDEAATAQMSNELFYANRCSIEGGDAMALDGGVGGVTRVTATNITVANHDCEGRSAILMEADSQLTVMNSIIWSAEGTTDIFFQEANCSVDISYSDFRSTAGEGANGNALLVGPGNIDSDPLFVDPAAGDYHLKSVAGRYDMASETWVTDPVTSPAIDRANPSSSFDLEPTPNGGRADMGAYGDSQQASLSE